MIAIIQAGPVYFNLHESINKALFLIKEAAKSGAKIVVFGETWLSGYPAWIDYCPDVAVWNNEAVKNSWADLFKNGVEIKGKEVILLKKAAKENGVYIIIGINEIIKKGKGNGTIYNAIITINNNGELLNHHRKLMPTFSEKLVYGIGDGFGLNSFKTTFGTIGSLICWEHWMPLARQTMHDEAEDFHFALWPSVHEIHQLASRNYAFEGRCYVVAVGQVMRARQIPKGLKLPDNYSGNELLLNGGSCVIGPNGKFLLEPQFNKEEIIYFEIPSSDILTSEKMNLSVSGHYQRHDVFELNVNKKRYF
ncbi:MAG: carbon-nitrogen hydrolase family protein [Chlorobi bacterium]|nr:carbon-nitrogen hydrolase family protein [Chlorobiota bacterium]